MADETHTLKATESCFPEFAEGQSLTHVDLNLLRDFLYSRFAFHNRALLGFGVACGLEGAVAGNDFTVSRGFALAQAGRELILDPGVSVPLASITALPAAQAPDFIDSTRGGFTPIIRPKDTKVEPSEDCTEAGGCRAHGVQWCLGAEIVFAAGQLKPTGFSQDPIFALDPLTKVSKTEFNALTNALGATGANPGFLKGYLDDATLKLLTDLTLDGSASARAIDMMKIGLVNEVLYTAWEFFRCRAISSGDCFGRTGAPAVALGWLSKPSTKWEWDCRHRHDFDLALALYRAINGFGCRDLCARHLDHIRVILETFNPPATPQDPKREDPKIELQKKTDYWYGRKGSLPYKVELIPIKKPPLFIDLTKTTRPKPRPDPGPLKTPFVTDTTDLLFESTVFDPMESGLIGVLDVLGYAKQNVLNTVGTAITAAGFTPQLTTMPAEELMKQAADPKSTLELRLVGAVSDALVFGLNEKDAVVSMGVHPTSRALGEAGGAVGGFRHAVAEVQSGFATLTTTYNAEFTQFQQQTQGNFEAFVKGFPDQEVLGKAAAVAGTYDKDIGELQQATKTLGERVDRNAHDITTRVDTVSQRFDAQAIAIGRPGRVLTPELGSGLLGTLGAMTSALDAAGLARDAPERRALDQRLEELRKLVEEP